MPIPQPFRQATVFQRSPLWLALTMTPLAHAAPVSMDAIQVTADRLGNDIEEASLQRYQADDLDDIFNAVPDVAVGGGSPVSQKVYVRGLEDTLLNVTIDGAAQSGYLFHHQGRLMLDPELLKRVSVGAGAGSATDGAGALGGSIRFVTKDPEDMLRDGENIGVLAKAGYFSNTEGYRTSTSVFGRLSDDWSAMGTLAKTEHNDYKDGDGKTQPYTESSVVTGFAKIVGQLTDEQRLSISYENNNDEASRKHRPHWSPSFKNPVFDQEMTRNTVTGNYHFDSRSNEWLDLEVTLFTTETSLKHIDGPYGTYLGELESQGINIRNTSVLQAHSLTYGIENRQDEGRLNTAKETASVSGLYLQDDYQVTEHLMFSGGLRYDNYELDEKTTNQTFDQSGFSPNLGFSLDVTDELNLYGGWAQAMRGPKVKELFVLDYYTNAADLKEETAENVEVGASYRSGNLYASAEVYVTTIDDVIAQESKAVLGNVGELKTKGVTATVGYDGSALSASLSYSQSRPELNGTPLSDDDWSLGTSVGDTWIAQVDYQATENLDIGWTGHFAERLTKVADGFTEKPGYGVSDVYAKWSPLAQDQLTVSLSINNLFDKQYANHASYGNYGEVAQGLPDPGRDIRFGVAMRL